MYRDYGIVSPQIDGVLRHESLSYQGIARPAEINAIFDRPARARREDVQDPHKQKIIEQYFQDLSNIFMKKLSEFVLAADVDPEESVKLQALLQEMIKMKEVLTSSK